MRTPTPEIRQALYRRLLDALPIGGVEAADVAWPNAPFTPKADRMWIEPFCLFGETEEASLGPTGIERLCGVFQIAARGVPNQGEAALDEICAQLVDLYRAGARLEMDCLNPVLILRSCRSGLLYEDGRPKAVVSANWINYAQKGV